MQVTIKIELIARCLSNDREGQRLLYDTLLPYLNLICKRYLNNQSELNDALQNTFVNIFRNLQQFDIQKASFKTWSTRIAINCCLQLNKKNERQATQELVVGMHDPILSPAILNQLSNADLLKWLKKMPKNYYDVFNLYIIDGFSHTEIANLLQIDEAVSRQRLSRGRAWLKSRLPSGMLSSINFN